MNESYYSRRKENEKKKNKIACLFLFFYGIKDFEAEGLFGTLKTFNHLILQSTARVPSDAAPINYEWNNNENRSYFIVG